MSLKGGQSKPHWCGAGQCRGVLAWSMPLLNLVTRDHQDPRPIWDVVLDETLEGSPSCSTHTRVGSGPALPSQWGSCVACAEAVGIGC